MAVPIPAESSLSVRAYAVSYAVTRDIIPAQAARTDIITINATALDKGSTMVNGRMAPRIWLAIVAYILVGA